MDIGKKELIIETIKKNIKGGYIILVNEFWDSISEYCSVKKNNITIVKYILEKKLDNAVTLKSANIRASILRKIAAENHKATDNKKGERKNNEPPKNENDANNPTPQIHPKKEDTDTRTIDPLTTDNWNF